MQEVVSDSPDQATELGCIAPLLEYWEGKFASDIRPKACRDYVKWRTAQYVKRQEPKSAPKRPRKRPYKPPRLVSKGTARRDLEIFRAAVRFYHEEYVFTACPIVKLPERAPARNEWLTRSSAAALLWRIWRNKQAKHLARIVLIALYSGTRTGAVLKLRWLASTSGGWIDLDHKRLYRKGQGERETKKRQPPAPIHARLLPHLRRWHRMDMEGDDPTTYVNHFRGKPLKKLRRSWRTACDAIGLSEKNVPHTLRHTAATWLAQAGVDPWEAAGYLGMSVEVFENTYGHHHPDYQSNAASAIAPKKRPGNTVNKRAPTPKIEDASA
jgi:integrase